MRLRSKVSAFLTAVVLAGCAAEHRLMRPAEDARFPMLAGDADQYLAHRREWTRREALGIKGEIAATFEDPALGADYLAHLARTQGIGEVRKDGYFETMWAALYGTQGDRLPIQVTLHFDRLFYGPSVLKPERWDFTLEDDAGRQWKPLHIGDHESAPAAQGKMAASFRLWFKAQQPGMRPMIDGRTRELVLQVRGESGAASLRWKFKPANPDR